MLSKIIKVILLVVVLAFLGYIGLSIWSCNFANTDNNTGQPGMPCKEEAAYSFYIENTGGLYLSDSYEKHGSVVGSQVFVLHGFWQIRGKDYKFVDDDIILDERIFGEITVEKRTKD